MSRVIPCDASEGGLENALSELFSAFIAVVAAVTVVAVWSSLQGRQGTESRADAEERVRMEERLRSQVERMAGLERDVQNLRAEAERWGREKAEWQARSEEQSKHLSQQKQEYEAQQQKLREHFRALAGEVLRENSKEFSEQHRKQLGELLSPFKEKIEKFEKNVDEKYDKGLRDHSHLMAEMRKIGELNQQLSSDAQNLSKALKGDVQRQGRWGEMILERILERSGLRKGEEYLLQDKGTNEEGVGIRPDAVILLPDERHVVVDAKVSLVAYERWVSAETEEERARYIQEHVASLRQHIRLLGDKKYHTAEKYNSPDFVLMFLPIESSFGLAVREDQQLFDEAWSKRVIMVSPSTLLATLCTVENLWRQEKQNRNALQIAEEGSKLYAKFVGFVEDLTLVGVHIDKTRSVYEDAYKKLSTGRGNLVQRVEKIRLLGAKADKRIDARLLDEAEAGEEGEQGLGDPA